MRIIIIWLARGSSRNPQVGIRGGLTTSSQVGDGPSIDEPLLNEMGLERSREGASSLLCHSVSDAGITITAALYHPGLFSKSCDPCLLPACRVPCAG